MAQFKIDGLSDIERRLKGLGRAAATRVVRNMVAGGGRLMAKKVKEALPRKGQTEYATGGLRKSISYRQLGIKEGVVRARRPEGSHWHLYEYGTEKQAATFASTNAVKANVSAASKKALETALTALEREYSKLGIK